MADLENQTIDVKSFVKGQASLKGLNLTKVAEKLDKRQSSLSGVFSRKKMNLQTFIDILNVLDEEFVIVLKNGNQFKIEM